MCGEHIPAGTGIDAAGGSSPRVRGTRICDLGIGQRWRFIPACAGNTPFPIPLSVLLQVHPRVCGEHGTPAKWGCIKFGSSPRVRGTPQCHRRRWARRRFIPACAGNTAASKSLNCPFTVHPRVCGEHHSLVSLDPCRSGSSPRVRGTQLCDMCWGQAFPVHPRVCGEHCHVVKTKADRTGSSPRVRGTRYRLHHQF